MTLFQERGSKRGLVECVAGLASVVARSDTRRAAYLFGAVEAQFEAIGANMWPADRIEYKDNVAAVRAVLGQAKFASAWAEGRAMTLEEAVELAQRGAAEYASPDHSVSPKK